MTKKGTESDLLRLPKGMRDLIGPTCYAYQGLIEKAAEIAHYYGFTPIETPVLEFENLFTSGVGTDTDIVQKEIYTLRTKGGDKLALRPEGTAPVMRAYFENGMQAQPQPVMLYYHGPYFRHDNPQKGRYRQFYQFGLEVIGTSKSIADATIIKISTLIFEEAGVKDLTVKINSLGDKECRPTYRRELINYYKKHLKEVCPDCRERFKTNPLRLLDCKEPKCQAIKAEAPSAVSTLCPACKAHFREVLEYLEALNITYEIDNSLVRGLDYYSRTVFEFVKVDETGAGLSLGGGGRYDYLAKALGSRRDVPAAGVGIGLDRILLLPDIHQLSPRIVKKPKVFFIQLSYEAKLKSLAVIEILRKAKIPLAQSLPKDSLGTQLALAEKLQVPYAIILGQKEAIEESVIVRNLTTRSQDTVKIAKLGEYLKGLK